MADAPEVKGNPHAILLALYRVAHGMLTSQPTSPTSTLWRELGDALAEQIGEKPLSRPAAASVASMTARQARPITMPPARRGAVQAPFPVPVAVGPRRLGPQGHGPARSAPVSVVAVKPPPQPARSAKNAAAANAILAEQAAKAKQGATPIPVSSRDIRVRDDVAAELAKIAATTGKPSA